jgi:uncharacterized protein
MADIAAPMPVQVAPVSAAERISSIDVLRGTALLGIAIMNIIFSGIPMAADWNPKVSGGASGPNLVAFMLQYILFDGKFRGIFSIMFGASSYYLVSRAVNRGAGIAAAEVYYRRILWLMLFGIIHAYLIWHGDILYPYALLGLVLFPLHRARPKWLLVSAGVALLAMSGFQIVGGVHVQEIHRLALEAEKATAEKKALTDEQKSAQTEWESMRKYVNPSKDDLKKEHNMYSGSYFNLVWKRAALVKEWHNQAFYMSGWDMFTMMLIGIAFAKTGVLAAQKSTRFYTWLMLGGYGIGLPIGSIAAWLAYKQGFEPLQTVFVFTTYQAARIAMTMGHMSALLLICKAGLFAGLQKRLAAVGQMAFSNYIAHSLIYGIVFYGYGFNLFDKLQRYQLYYVVLGMWVFSLIASPMWLAHYRFGPLEWCWRSLTYWKRQPMRLVVETAPEGALEAAAGATS